MDFMETLNHNLDQRHLLKHSFYQAWNRGELSLSTLKTYAAEYYHHVAAFPRYISAIHSQCEHLETRQVLLENLIEEERGDLNHPGLWKDFSEEVGATWDDLAKGPRRLETKQLVDGYFDLVHSDFATGLGALYAYERQTPAVSQSKIDGLKAFYGIGSEKALQFFNVHTSADVWHTQECATLIAHLDSFQKERAATGAVAGAVLLWSFLDGMMDEHNKAIN